MPATPQPSQTRLKVARNEDTATESESEPESIELGPGDSISQRLPTTFQPIPALSIPSLSLPIATNQTYNFTNKNKPLNKVPRDSDIATVDESGSSGSELDLQYELDTAHTSKRRRLLRDPLTTTALHPRASQVGTSGHHSTIPFPNEFLAPRSDNTTGHPSARVFSACSPRPTALSQPDTTRTTHTSPPVSLSGLPQPPPSDLNGLLAWAARLAGQITHSPVPANQASISHQAGQTSNPNNQLAQALDNLRACLTTSTTTSPANIQRPTKRPRHTDLVEDNAEVLELEAALTLGTHVVSLFVVGIYCTLKFITSVPAASQISQTSRVCGVASPLSQFQNFSPQCALREPTRHPAHSTIGPRRHIIVSGSSKRQIIRYKRRLMLSGEL